MPILAAIPAVLGAIGAGVGVTGAGITAGMSIAAGLGVVGMVGGLAAGVAGSIQSSIAANKQAKAMQDAQNASGLGNAATTVDATTAANVNQLGRAALISTSPQGVQGTDSTGRYRLLGN